MFSMFTEWSSKQHLCSYELFLTGPSHFVLRSSRPQGLKDATGPQGSLTYSMARMTAWARVFSVTKSFRSSGTHAHQKKSFGPPRDTKEFPEVPEPREASATSWGQGNVMSAAACQLSSVSGQGDGDLHDIKASHTRSNTVSYTKNESEKKNLRHTTLTVEQTTSTHTYIDTLTCGMF